MKTVLKVLIVMLSAESAMAQSLPTQENAPPPAPADAPAQTVAPRVAPQPATSPALIKVAPNCQIGLVTGNIAFDTSVPSNYCVDNRVYIGAAGRLGRINLFRRPPLEAGLKHGFAMVSATLEKNLFKRLTPRGACPKFQPKVYQFRSDWYADEGGYDNTEIKQLERATYLEMTGEIIPINILHYEIPKYKRSYRHRAGPKIPKPVVITIRNPFTTPLSDLTLLLHFEGGGGKPMPLYEEVKLSLKPGEQVTRTVMTHKKLPTGKGDYKAWWRFQAAALEGTAGGCTFWPTTHRR